MKPEDIDLLIERYTEERKHVPRQVAQQHLLAYAYLVCHGNEIDPFFKRIRRLATFQIDSLQLFENPLRNAQACWLIFIPVWFLLSLNMLADQNFILPGLISCAATVIFGTSLVIMVIGKWIDIGIQTIYYREIIDLVDSQQPAAPCQSPA
jgi:hypothetical protein